MQKAHNLGGDNLRFALFTSSVDLGSVTTQYRTTNEISGTGYSAGGALMSDQTVFSVGSSSVLSGGNFVWTSASFTANGGLLYNDTHADNAAIGTYAFGGDKTVTNGTFTVQLPAATEGAAFVEIDDS
ncbi:hypothetical protein LCGC14_3095090 [marine sediment metagenome]|uniref:Uncharacterized protein n=1 Tax=marine sediment metagenome TaxID=412755 RepID=A0A0F8W9Y5_9ZZZZ